MHTNSICAEFDGIQPHGWFPIGGTSLSSPLWTGIVADRDSFTMQRTGNLNPLIYLLYNLSPQSYFHDITGVGQLQATATSNGLYPTSPATIWPPVSALPKWPRCGEGPLLTAG